MPSSAARRRPAIANAFEQDVVAGLSGAPKSIPARYFYDRAGSELFDRITALPDYYPTRTEIGLLTAHSPAIAAAVGPGRAVVEFGAGSATKTPTLLRALAAPLYVPVDISGEFLLQSSRALAQAHPGLEVMPVAADFTGPMDLPRRLVRLPLLGFFPGSTIGNFSHPAAIDLLRRFRAILGADSWLLIGIDTRKDPAILLPAYDDAQGVTAAFNLNVLHRINRELDADIDVGAFAHRIVWNAELGRIEMHLQVRTAQRFRVAGVEFSMVAGETIHTENSYKYTPAETALLAHGSGWVPVSCWTDRQGLFSLNLWQAAVERREP